MTRKLRQRLDLVGQSFGRLTVIERGPDDRKFRTYWRCRCICGNEVTVQAYCLTTSKNGTKSCGCLQKERASQAKFKHGSAKKGVQRVPEYKAWMGMKQRCSAVNNDDYPRYGGRGIKVCERWLHSYESFIADMGPRPSGCSLDRINNDGDYEPTNCRWATAIQQASNKSSCVFLTARGQTKSLAKWAEDIGIQYHTLKSRILAGWSIDRALDQPLEIQVH